MEVPRLRDKIKGQTFRAVFFFAIQNIIRVLKSFKTFSAHSLRKGSETGFAVT